jgi:hypothetical protein
MALQPVANGANIPALLSPFFVLYDFRVAASHLTSTDRANQIMATITGRLNIEPGAGLLELYNVLSEALAASYESFKGTKTRLRRYGRLGSFKANGREAVFQSRRRLRCHHNSKINEGG